MNYAFFMLLVFAAVYTIGVIILVMSECDNPVLIIGFTIIFPIVYLSLLIGANEYAVLETTVVETPIIKLDERYYAYSYENLNDKEVVISTEIFKQTKIEAVVLENDDVKPVLKTISKEPYNIFLQLFVHKPVQLVVEVPTGTVNRMLLEN